MFTYLTVCLTTTAFTVANSTPEMSTSAPKSINIIHLSVGPSELGIGIDPKNHLVKSLDRGNPNFKIIYKRYLLLFNYLLLLLFNYLLLLLFKNQLQLCTCKYCLEFRFWAIIRVTIGTIALCILQKKKCQIFSYWNIITCCSVIWDTLSEALFPSRSPLVSISSETTSGKRFATRVVMNKTTITYSNTLKISKLYSDPSCIVYTI